MVIVGVGNKRDVVSVLRLISDVFMLHVSACVSLSWHTVHHVQIA